MPRSFPPRSPPANLENKKNRLFIFPIFEHYRPRFGFFYMLSYQTILQGCLEGLLSLSARLHLPGTGSWWQEILLRAMGARVGGPVYCAPGCSFLGAKNLRFGRYVSLGAGSRVVSWLGVTVGDHFMASDFLNINDGNHDPVTLFPKKGGEIKIGSRVWCGTHVTICAGVEIGDDVIIGAGSVVVKSIPSNTIAAGVPARPIRVLERKTTGLWSFWPEASAEFDWKNIPLWKRRLHWLRARI